MYNYAQVNESMVVVGVSSLSGLVESASMIAIPLYDLSLLGKLTTEKQVNLNDHKN